MMFAISWQLAVMTLLFFPILHFSAQSTIRKIKESSGGLSSESNLLGRNISNALSSISLVKLYGQEEMESERFNKKSNELLAVENKIAIGVEMLAPIRDFVVLISISLLIAMIWYVRADSNAVGVGKYLVFILVLRRSASLFGSINQSLAHLAEVDGPLREINDVVVEGPKTQIIHSGERTFRSFEHKIEIRDLNFNYSSDKIGLKGINLTIKKGEFIAIVGRSGAGKTTLMNILARYYDCPEGAVFVDGVDIRNYSNLSWRFDQRKLTLWTKA
jgi:subfamily B ATP-binding cassette protein MsbA